jgi:nucleoside-diphosphate-sugar epimerase
MKVVVTGATGFIGLAIARDAAARGDDVVALHRSGPAPGLDARWMTYDEWFASDERADVVVHAAAQRHRHGVRPEDYLGINVKLTRDVIERTRVAGARLVHVSSISVYGWPPDLPIDEARPYAPIGPYGRSKVETEEMVADAGIPYVIVQPSITYGPGDTNGMIDKMMRMIARGRFVVPGLGRTRVQLVYIDDLARLTMAAARSREALGQRFICTYKEPIRVGDLVRGIARAVSSRVVSVGPPTALLRVAARSVELLDRAGLFRGAEPPITREKLATISVDRAYRIDRMRGLLHDEPQVGYQEGLRRTAESMGLA